MSCNCLLELWVTVVLKDCTHQSLISLITGYSKLVSWPPLLICIFSRVGKNLEAEIVVILAVGDKARSLIHMFWKCPRYAGNFTRGQVRGMTSWWTRMIFWTSLIFSLAIVQEGRSSGDNGVEGVNNADCIDPGYCCQCLNHWCLREKFVVVDFNSESIKCCSCQVLSLQI